jgi:hypothetical protein
MKPETAIFALMDEQSEEQPPAESATPPEVQEKPRVNPLHVLAGVLIHPRAAFERMRDTGRTHWWLVLVLALAVGLAGAYASTTTRGVAFQAQTPSAGVPAGGAAIAGGMPGMPPGQGGAFPAGQSGGTQSVQPSAGAAFSVVAIGLSTFSSVAGALVGYLVCATVVFAMLLIVGGKTSFRQIFPVAVWSSLPLIVRQLVHAVVTLVTGRPSVAGFRGLLTTAELASMPLVGSLLGQFDIYLLWNLVLLGIGVAVTAKLSRGKSVAVVLAYVVVAAGLLILLSLGGQFIGQLLGVQIGLPGFRRFGG